ncbi:MAG: ABC transporter permease [Chloroflexi bacterium]|nr:ABC transporter permease [Chloroflexota bacterium]MCI0647067.1 ABC transporter permease [Chloroflexota bacterium]MCI0731554.1 ABC transporter permease [Chloroflexota bacterium]
MLDRIWIIAWKETIDNLRDRRSVGNALGTVLFNPIFYIVLFGFVNRSVSQQAERPLQLPVVGAAHAPNLVAYLEQNNVEILAAPAEPEAAVRSGEADVILVIPDSYGESFSSGRPAPVQLLADESNNSASIVVDRAEELLQEYSGRVGNLRLLARGISPAALAAVPVDVVDVSPATQGGASSVLNLLPVIMITAAFFGGFYLAVDTTAGERERESLEPLLLNPVPRWAILLGKYLAALAFTIVATGLATSAFILLLRLPQVQEFTNIRLDVNNQTLLTAVLLMVPVVTMAVALEMLIAARARSVREAQTYTQLVALVGFLPAVFLSVLPVKQQAWMQFVPTVAQLFLVNNVSRGEPLDWPAAAVASAITLLLTVAALAAAIRYYYQERIVLGK